MVGSRGRGPDLDLAGTRLVVELANNASGLGGGYVVADAVHIEKIGAFVRVYL